MKKKIAFWFRNGIWSESMVRDAVIKNKISKEEFLEIVGRDYE